MASEELDKIDSVVRVTKLNRYFIYREAAAGRIPCYRAGKAVRFNIPEVLAWMRQQQLMRTNGHGE